MHFTSLFRTTLTIFAGLYLSESLVSALSVPTIKAIQRTPEGQAPISLPMVKTLLDKRGNQHVQTIPYFAFYQPDGTQPVYRKDDKERTIGIDFIGTDKKAVRKLDIEWGADSNKIDTVAIRDLPFNIYPDTKVETGFTTNNERLEYYRIETLYAVTDLQVMHAGRYATVLVNVLPDQENFALEKIAPWDGVSLPLTPGPKVASA
ncbi:hypothetical protein THASP1DRAFT_24857 [Thamnocephalis sphaerospora]|uniref:Uncharacterized protein n=1 Tax=Thamnocephalis sphaerospora TaxID=78915 RepID=A0A4V1IWA7_9FUNG|nr:hypothetical protein THASP1DRAFT_24857 [Thamnocephalis sphaerospora]|eukprot:RKP06899.1 hypothetical protein THASP1DRAFT_24857 [Thamnocephalis sphaerospora]